MKLNFSPALHSMAVSWSRPLVIVGIISLALGSYLKLPSGDANRTVVSAYTWNTALPYAEAGSRGGLDASYMLNGGSNLVANGWTADGADWVRIQLDRRRIILGSYLRCLHVISP